eukprot:436107-Pleurochrysis_carterae.AAC.1
MTRALRNIIPSLTRRHKKVSDSTRLTGYDLIFPDDLPLINQSPTLQTVPPDPLMLDSTPRQLFARDAAVARSL